MGKFKSQELTTLKNSPYAWLTQPPLAPPC